MDSKKNFDAYAKSLFGDDYSGKKDEKVSAPWSNTLEAHPRPLDVIVVDSNDKVLTDDAKDKKNRTGKGKRLETPNNHYKEDGRLTPIVIDMNDSPFENNNKGPVLRKRKKPEGRESHYDFHLDLDEIETSANDKYNGQKRKDKSNLERTGSERDDSGISLTDDGEENEAFQLNIFPDRLRDREDSESDNDLAYFCVDHMKMCTSRRDFLRHRKCHLESGTNSPAAISARRAQDTVRKKSSLLNNEKESPITPENGSSLSGGSRGSSRAGRTSAAAFMGMQSTCRETLEKLYYYAGVIIEDRQSLKEELRDKKIIVEEMMLESMEEIITHLLQLKNKCLAVIKRRHNESILKVTQQLVRIQKIQHETYNAWQTLQVPEDLTEFEAYKKVILNAGERSMVLQEILRTIYKSCDNYVIEFKTAPHVTHILDSENVACVEKIPAIPLLPPFLSVKSFDDIDDDPDYTSVKSIEKIEDVDGKHESGNEKCCFTGCAYIMDDSVLLADWSNGVIKLLNNLGLVADRLEFQQSPWDVVQSYAGQAAVTVPQLQTVFFVEAEPHLRIVGNFNTRCDCFGICKIDENFAITCDPWSKSPSVRVFDRLGNTLLKVQSDSIRENYFKCPLHICSDYFNSVMYVSDAAADCVYAISVSGDIIFCYHHEDLEYPTGVTTDRNNCLFVCGKASSNIHKLNNGSLAERLIQKQHGLSSPCAIAFHPNGDHMIVTDLESEMSSGYWKLKFM